MRRAAPPSRLLAQRQQVVEEEEAAAGGRDAPPSAPLPWRRPGTVPAVARALRYRRGAAALLLTAARSP